MVRYPVSHSPDPDVAVSHPGTETGSRGSLLLARGEGVHVWDTEGRRYLDGTSGAFCVQLGYSRVDLVRAASEAASRLPHARPSIAESEETAAYRRELLAAAGPSYARVVLTSSGSEAVDVALKIAYRYQSAMGRPGRSRVAYLDGHYHGQTLAALAVTGWNARRGPYERALGPSRGGPAAFCLRCFEGRAYPSCGIACARAALTCIEPVTSGESLTRAEPLSAVILETVPAAGLGAPVPPPGYLARIQALAEDAGALWIADEVLTGFGRTGSLFAWQRLAERAAPDGSRPDREIRPDLVVFGKGAGAGYASLAGVIVAEPVARALEVEEFAHHQTHGGSPVAAAVGRRVLRAMQEEGVWARVRSGEGALRASLAMLTDLPWVLDVRGIGYLVGIELVRSREDREPFPCERRIAERVQDACRARGLLIHAGSGCVDGARGDYVLLAPPLVSDREVFDEAARILREAIEKEEA